MSVAVLLAAFPVHAKTPGEVYEQAAKSTVVVLNMDGKGKTHGLGSGVILPDRDVVTNCHVVKGAGSLKVRIGKQEYLATLRHSDWDRDVCSLSVSGVSAPAVVIGSTKTLKVGAKVYAIGAPKGLELTLSDGIVSSLREVDGGQYIQTTAAISPGSSGGGLFDENGALVGLTTFYLAEGQNLNFAVPVEWVKELPKRSVKTATDAQTVTQWLNRAVELESRKDWPAAIEHCRRWTQAQPVNARAWYSLGVAYARAGQSANAIEAFKQALRINPEDASAWYNLGIANGKTGQIAQAIEAFQQALRINPEFADAWDNLGTAYNISGQSTKAIEAFQQALRISPEHANTWNKLGTAYDESNQSAKAIETFQQALRINPEHAGAWNNLGVTYARAGQSAKAIEAYQQALRIDPKDADAWFNLGVEYEKADQPAQVIEALQQALRINPEHARAWYNLGIAYGKVDLPANAIEAYQWALRIDPEHVRAWYNLGVEYSLSGQRDKVLEVYKRLKILDPSSAERFFKNVVMP